MMRFTKKTIALELAFLGLWMAALGFAAEVRGNVSVADQKGAVQSSLNKGVAVWLVPLSDAVGSGAPVPGNKPRPKLVQKNKRFVPHILVVQAGSVVDFPNRDPFFHNVFSLFNGKRFDLGLYEAGSTRSVHFDRAGICYIFCNIHPQMSAVVVVVDTPYYTLADEKGEFRISGVPAGTYRLSIWEEHATPESLRQLSRKVVVGQETVNIASVKLHEAQKTVMIHTNKYGKSYDPQVFSSPIYVQP